MSHAYAEPDRILLCRHGDSWQGTARNGGFFVVGDFTETQEEAMANCVEKYRAEVEKKFPKPVPKPMPKKPYDPLDFVMEDL